MSETVGRIEQLTTELKTASPFRSVEITRQLLDVTEVLRAERLAKLAVMEERQRCLGIVRYVGDEVDYNRYDGGTAPYRIVEMISSGRSLEELLAADHNEQIDADLAREYEDTHEGECDPSQGCGVEKARTS